MNPAPTHICSLEDIRHNEHLDPDDAVISEGDGNGAYVQSWVWLSFDETPFDKQRPLKGGK